MRYEIEEQNVNLNQKYAAGKYFIDAFFDLFSIVEDRDRGLAILRVKDGQIVSDFHEEVDDLIKYTTIVDMNQVEQFSVAKFKYV